MVSSSHPPATQQQNIPLPAAPLPGLRPSTSQHLHQPPLALATTSTSSSCTAPPTLQLSDFPTSRQVGKRTPGAHRPFLTYPASKPHPHALTNSRTPPPAVAQPRRHSLYPPPSYPPPCIRCSHVLLPRGKRKPSAVHTTTRPPRCIVHTSSHPAPSSSRGASAVTRLNPPTAAPRFLACDHHPLPSPTTTARARSFYPGVRENPPPCTPHHTPPPHPPHQHHAEEEPNAAKRPTPAPPLAASSSLTPG